MKVGRTEKGSAGVWAGMAVLVVGAVVILVLASTDREVTGSATVTVPTVVDTVDTMPSLAVLDQGEPDPVEMAEAVFDWYHWALRHPARARAGLPLVYLAETSPGFPVDEYVGAVELFDFLATDATWEVEPTAPAILATRVVRSTTAAVIVEVDLGPTPPARLLRGDGEVFTFGTDEPTTNTLVFALAPTATRWLLTSWASA